MTSNSPCDGGIIFDGAVNPNLGCTMRCDTVSTVVNLNDSLLAWQAQGYECHWANYGKKLYGYRCESVCDTSSPDPNMEAVRVWVAQEDGYIDVRSALALLCDSSESRLQSYYVDGIIYSIQLSSGNLLDADTLRSQRDTILWEGFVAPDNYLQHLDTIRNLQVNQGDLLFFRLKSVNNHSFDKVRWRQEILYRNVSGTDDYGQNRGLYQSDSDLVLCGQSYFRATGGGTVWE